MAPTLKFGRLRLVNFGSFVDECELQLDQGPGLWFISGRNLVDPQRGPSGAGKTTLLNALYWTMTGRTMRSRRPGAKVEARRGKGVTEVELDCLRGRTSLNIKRTRKPNSLTLNGNPITDADLLNELGIKPEVLQYTCLFGQSTPMFLSIGKEEQAALFNDLLDLDIWLKAADKAKAIGKTAEDAVERAQKDINEITGRIAGFREARKEALNQADTFEVETKTKIEAFYKQQKTKMQELDKTKAALKALGEPADFTKLEEQRAIADTKIRVIQNRKATALSARTSAANGLKNAEEQLKKAKDAMCDACGQALPADVKKRRVTKLTDLIGIYSTDIKRHDSELKEFEENIDTWDKKRRAAIARLIDVRTADSGERPQLQRQITILETELAAVHRDITHLLRTVNPHEQTAKILLARIKTDKNSLEDATADLKRFEGEATLSKLWQTSTKEIRLSIIDEALEETAAMATKHAERLGLHGWRISLSTERQNAAGNTTLGFNAFLYPDGETDPVAWETYSGGEENSLQLAMSFGLADVLLARAGLSPNLMFIDEPTRGLPSEGISDLLECLVDQARDSQKTIYLIDHHSLDRGNFTGMIMVEKSKTGSHIVEA